MLDLAEAGRRLKTSRLAAQLSIDEVARRTGVSRALLYRYEAGDIVKLDVLDRLARLYEASTLAVLGLDQEYFTDGIGFFERLQQIEAESEHATIMFGPLAYVLTSDAYDEALMRALAEPTSASEPLSAADRRRMARALMRRKAAFRAMRPTLVNLIPLADIERYLASGLAGGEATAVQRGLRRRAALDEVEHLAGLIGKPPIGLQIALTTRTLPTTGFQLLRSRGRRLLVTSPFRLGNPINLHYGVAMVSSEERALLLHERLIDRLWDGALTGNAAVKTLHGLMQTHRP